MIPSRETDKDEWIKWRRENRAIGSSEIAIILGLNKYKSPLQLYHDWLTGSEIQDNDWMFLGRELEPTIIKLYKRQNPEADIQPNQTTFSHPTHNWAIATPDCFINEKLGEVKNVSGELDIWKEGIPDAYHCQVIWQMGVTGRTSGKIIAMYKGSPELYVHDIEFDADLFEAMLDAADRFREQVARKIAPAPSELDGELLGKLYKAVPEKEVELFTKDDCLLAEGYEIASEELSKANKVVTELEKKRDSIKNKIRGRMGDASTAKFANGFVAQVKEIHVKEFVRKASSYTKFSIFKSKK